MCRPQASSSLAAAAAPTAARQHRRPTSLRAPAQPRTAACAPAPAPQPHARASTVAAATTAPPGAAATFQQQQQQQQQQQAPDAAQPASAEQQQPPPSEDQAQQQLAEGPHETAQPEPPLSRSGEAPLAVEVRPIAGLLELRAVARLRAEAYYAEDRSRFAESFKRQFASQEVDSLQHRTQRRGGRAQQCDCLVAVDPATQAVVGCIDIRVPQSATGMAASGVPPGEPGGAYILNVVVDEAARGRGVGRQLMRAAMARAVGAWGAARLFTHVEAGNDVASGLYRGCGFVEHSDSAAYAGAAILGGSYGWTVGWLVVGGVWVGWQLCDTRRPCVNRLAHLLFSMM
jgi:ribosomal protein S18 acetylase RimI-like enzyme